MNHPSPPPRVDTDASVGVLFVHTDVRRPLGADVWVHVQIMRALDKRLHDVHVACVTGPTDHPTPTFEAVRDIDGVQVIPMSPGPDRDDLRRVGRWPAACASAVRSLVDVVQLARLVRRQRIAVVHTTDRPRDALVTVLLGWVTRARSVVHVHVTYGPWMGGLRRWAIRRADGVIAISRFVADRLSDGVPKERIHVVLNAIDAGAWRPELERSETRAELGIDPTTPVVITVCRLFEEKGVLPLIEAMAEVRDRIGDVRLLVVGAELHPGGGYLRGLEATVEALDLADVVAFLGRRADVEGLLAAADLFAMPSFEEPFGLVFLEAMAMRLPVVALVSGGAPEMVTDGATGLLVEPGDTPALAEALVELLSDPMLRRTMGDRGRERVEESFSVGRLAADVARVYRLLA